MSRPIRRPRPESPERPENPPRLTGPETPTPLEGGLRERRAQRQTMIADMIAEMALRTQTQIQEMLFEKMGIMATQSSISRDLRDLGVRRVKGVYALRPGGKQDAWDFEAVLGLVEAATRCGPHNTVIQTVPDAAQLVARTLQEAGWEEVLGIVAGDDAIFIATRTEEDQDRLFERFKKYLKG